jgi:hypothetical protein
VDKEYLFYFLDGFSTDCFVYNPARGLVDTLELPFAESDLSRATLSADGRTMFIKTKSSAYAMNLSTRDTVRILDESRSVIASPDGRYLAITDGEFQLLDATDYAIVFQDTVEIWAACFSTDHRTFYGGGMADNGYVYFQGADLVL